MNTANILKMAKAKIENPEHWCVHEEARNKHGLMVQADAPGACQWCAYGALFAVAPPPAARLVVECLDEVASKAIQGFEFLPGQDWVHADFVNDTTDHATVMRMYDLAIEKAERDGEPNLPRTGK